MGFEPFPQLLKNVRYANGSPLKHPAVVSAITLVVLGADMMWSARLGLVSCADDQSSLTIVPHALASVWRMSASSSSYMFWRRKSFASVQVSGVFA